MKIDIIVTLDVGGTFIKAGVVYKNNLLKHTFKEYPSHSNRSSEEVLNHFMEIITEQLELSEVLEHHIPPLSLGVGFSFPGLFDYDQGISYIKGLDKYESLYGISVHDEIMKRLLKSQIPSKYDLKSLKFENDARLFGLGASTLYTNEKIIALTIGTGLGSVFIENGKIIKNSHNTPPEGYLYGESYNGVCADDIFSRRGILNAAKHANIAYNNGDVKELAEIARDGNRDAIAVFQKFGMELAEFLYPFIQNFKPSRLILGGQITKSYDLFGQSLEQNLVNFINQDSTLQTPIIHTHNNAQLYTALGISNLFN